MAGDPNVPDLYNTDAQKSYQGPGELRIFADALPYFGELAISFAYVERRITWALKSLLGSTMHEANELESSVLNFTSRLNFLELVGLNEARKSHTEMEFASIISNLAKANTFRNSVFHNGFNGISQTFEPNGGRQHDSGNEKQISRQARETELPRNHCQYAGRSRS